jgi:hypothetical protein
LILTISMVSLARFDFGLCGFTPVLRQRFAHVITFLELSAAVPAHEPFISTRRNQFTFS